MPRSLTTDSQDSTTTVIEIRIDDLAFYEGDAIIRPVNEELGATTPLLRRLEQAAGEALATRLKVNEPLPVGAAVVTPGGALPTPLIVHGVVSSRMEPVTRDSVRRALVSALQRARDWQLRKVAIAPFGLGAGNLDIDGSAEIMFDVLMAHRKHSAFPEHVTIVAETPDEAAALDAARQRSGA